VLVVRAIQADELDWTVLDHGRQRSGEGVPKSLPAHGSVGALVEPRPHADEYRGSLFTFGSRRIDREHRICGNDCRPNPKRLKCCCGLIVTDRAGLAEPRDEPDETSACPGIEGADSDGKKRRLPPREARQRDRKEKFQERAKSFVLQNPAPSENDPV
jgi:hypothetical protein